MLTVPAELAFEAFKDLARDLKRSAEGGSARAALRVLRVIPDATASADDGAGKLSQADAQHVTAREAGFASWEHLCGALDIGSYGQRDAEDALVEAALAGHARSAAEILARWPNLGSRSLPCALVLASPDAAELVTKHTVNAQTGPRDWPPLLYLCHSQYRNGDHEHSAARVRLATELLRLGANPNAGTRETETIRGYRTALGAAIGQARSPALAKALLSVGADIADGPTLYEGCAMWEAVRARDLESLRALLASEPPQWHVCHALPHALQYDDVALTRLLLANGGDPNWTMGCSGFDGNCLHEAVMLGNSTEVVAALLEHGAQVTFRDRDRRTPLALATALDRQDLVALLREHGARDEEVGDVDRWVAACFTADPATAARLAVAHDASERTAVAALRRSTASPTDRKAARAVLAGNFRPADHLWLCRAIRGGDNAAVRLLLEGGLDPDAMDDDGARPLHLALADENAFVAGCLITEGADTGKPNFAGETPLDLALQSGGQTVDLLVRANSSTTPLRDADFPALFDRAADAVVAGDLNRLKAMIAACPDLVTARSPRPHRCTLLNYLGANGFEVERQKTPPNGVEMINYLIDVGSDPNAVCFTYRGGPTQTTTALLTSSSHPVVAGLTLPMVSALARGGATLDPVYRLLAEICNAEALPDQFDPSGEAARHALVETAMLAETDILFDLLNAGVDINAQRPDGTTALHHAAINGNVELVERLLTCGADLSLRDDTFDGTAAGWAHAGGHADLGEHLAARLRELGSGEQ